MMRFEILLFIIFYHTLLNHGLTLHNNKSNVPIFDKISQCTRTYNVTSIEFICPNEFMSNEIDINGLTPNTLESIERLLVTGKNVIRGPLTTIPLNICRFPRLKNLDLHYNKIQNVDFNFGNSCLSELRTLQLSNNFIRDLSVTWFNQMPLLEHIYLSSNDLTDLRYDTFNHLSHLRNLDVARNSLRTIELWTVQIEDTVNYQFNRIDRFSNKYNVDLSQIQSETIPEFYTYGNLRIQFDDTIFAMYNRCAEVHNSGNRPILTLSVLSIIEDTNDEQPFYQSCSCDQYYFYRTAFAIREYLNISSFDDWICPGHSIPFIQHCNNRSSANFIGVLPRLCKIDESEPGEIPVFVSEPPFTTTIPIGSTTQTTTITTDRTTISTTQPTTTSTIQPTTTSTAQRTTTTTVLRTTTTLSYPAEPHEIERYLGNITELNNSTIQIFTSIINNVNNNRNTTIGSNIPEQTKRTYQRIIRHIENLIESVNSSLNTSDAAVALISSTKTNPVYHFNQLMLSDSSIIYSFESESDNSTTSISIKEEHIQNLSIDKFYSFFYLPSLIFEYAQIDSRIEILSPIVGAHLPIEQSFNVQMSFHDNNSYRSSGSYSCVFWQFNRWNNTGCIYSNNITMNRHYCHCNHLTSFALIFTPDGSLRETFLPTIITSALSIIGLCLSIFLSVYQQTKPKTIRQSRRFSIANIFSLSSTLILFILFTSFLLINHQSLITQSTTSTSCQPSILNLVLAIYFFIILTFVSKTFLGIYYYFTIFVDFKPRLFNDRPNKCYLTSLLFIIITALIPTIVASGLSHQQNNIIVLKNNVCWFDGIYLIDFVTIPVSIFIGINLIIVILIGVCLFRFLCNTRVDQAKEKRLMIAACMWIASCVLLGIVWIVGPFLNLLVNENGQSTSTSSKAMQWIFALLTGLEGVWVLIVNILFYVRQRTNKQPRWSYSFSERRKWELIDVLGRIQSETKNSF